MFNDMIVVVEDLRNVEFNLILVDKRSKLRLKKNSGGNGSISSGSNQQQKSSPSVPILEYHSYPLPRITGSRSSLKVSQGNFDPNTHSVEITLTLFWQKFRESNAFTKEITKQLI